MTQKELLSLVAERDERAFTEIYDLYSRSLFSVISNHVKDHDDAQAVLQDTFLRIWREIDSYNEGKGRFYSWALNIARSESVAKMKSKGFDTDKKKLGTDNFVHLLDNRNRLSSRIDAIGIQDFVKRLKPKCIQVLELLFFKGYSTDDASETLEIPVGTVKSQNRNCINELRDYLQI